MNVTSGRTYQLLAGGAAVFVAAWLVLLGTGILTPEPEATPAALAEPPGSGPSNQPSIPPVESPSRPSASPTAEPSTGMPATRIVIDELGIDLPIYEGDGYTAELGKAAHYPTTSWPGSGTLIYLYAHARDDNFVALWAAEVGDIVELEIADGATVQYEVSRVLPDVRWNDLSVLSPTADELLRLQTCNSYEETAPRFIVEAVPVDRG